MSVKEIQKKLQALGNKEKAKKHQRFFKTGPGEYGEGDVFIGVTVPELRKLAKGYKTITLKELKQLLHSSIHEERLLSLFLLIHRYSKGDESKKKRIYELYLKNTKFINNWDLVVSVPRCWPERICWSLSDEYYNANQGHVRIYKNKDLVSLFESNGAKKWAGHFAHSLHTPYWWLKCLVGPTRDDSSPVNLYNRFLTWDIMKKPWITRFIDYLLNPILGKSIVLYFRKMKPSNFTF